MDWFKKNYVLRVSDFDAQDRILPSSILDIFQDVAGQNADAMEAGYDDLIKKDLIWVLLRCRIDIIKPPEFYQEVIAYTAPHVPGRADFDRDYLITDLNGNTLIKGTSKWCVLNFKTRKIDFGNAAHGNGKYFTQEKLYEEGIKKIANFSEEGCKKYSSKTGYCDLDHNGHVNNAKYANYILNAVKLPKDKKITAFEINYIHEMPSDSEFEVYYKDEEGGILAKCSADGEEIFRARIDLE